MPNYIEALRRSYQKAGNNVCLGLDPQWSKLPAPYRQGCKVHSKILAAELWLPDSAAIQDFLGLSLQKLQEQSLSPAAFKPNLGYFQALDRPLLALSSEGKFRDLAFGGSRLLAWLHSYLSQNFPGIPIILDFKKGDISRSSANYAEEGFALWHSDAVTVSPYMGSDSLSPFGQALRQHLTNSYPAIIQLDNLPQSLACKLPCGSGGVYSLLRTSNPGGRDLQDLPIQLGANSSSGQSLGKTQEIQEVQEGAQEKTQEYQLYHSLAATLLRWRSELEISGLGAVVGATSPDELEQLACLFSNREFPLLIPGVGQQGGSFRDVQQCLAKAGYPPELARINLSSGLLQSWDGEAPADWPQLICRKMAELM